MFDSKKKCLQWNMNRKRSPFTTVLCCCHSPGATRWCPGRWRGWAGPARRGRLDRWSSGGLPQTRRSCPWGSGAPDPARGPGQTLLCPGNGWTPSHWRCSAAPACPRGGGPVHRGWPRDWSLHVQEHPHCSHWECSSAGGEGWIGSYFF